MDMNKLAALLALPSLENRDILTCPMSSCSWFTFLFTVHTHNTNTVLSVRQQVYVKRQM